MEAFSCPFPLLSISIREEAQKVWRGRWGVVKKALNVSINCHGYFQAFFVYFSFSLPLLRGNCISRIVYVKEL